MKQESKVLDDIDDAIRNKGKQIQFENNQFFREHQNQQTCTSKMKNKITEFIEKAANFLECTRVFSDERLDMLKRNSIHCSSVQHHQSQSVKSQYSHNMDDLNNLSKISTKEDIKISGRDKQLREADYCQLPIKSYAMNQPLKFLKRYAQTYQLSYSERQSRFGYTFEQVRKIRENQEKLKQKTFWEEFKRLIFCRGGNYIEEIQQKQTEGKSDTNSEIYIVKRDVQPSLTNNRKIHQDNVFLIDQTTPKYHDMQEITLDKNLYARRKSSKNSQLKIQQKLPPTQPEVKKQVKMERSRKRRALDIKDSKIYTHQQILSNTVDVKNGSILNINSQVIVQDDDLSVYNTVNLNQKANNYSHINNQQNYQNNNYSTNNNFDNYNQNANNIYNQNYNNNQNYNSNYDTNYTPNYNSNYQNNYNNDFNNNSTNDMTYNPKYPHIVQFQDNTNQNPPQQTIQNVFDYAVQYQIQLNEQPTPAVQENKQKLQRRKKNKRQSKTVVIRDNENHNENGFDIDQL